jgi:hypothetical protein
MLTADSNKKFVLCITDAFTKYTVVTAIANKEAETVADAIFKDWFEKFGIPVQTEARSSSINSQQNFSSYSKFATPKPHLHIPSATRK